MNFRTDSKKIGLIAATAMFAALFAMPTMAAAATTTSSLKPTPYTGTLLYEITCQVGPCGTSNIYVEPYVSVNTPSWVQSATPGLETELFPGVINTLFIAASTSAKWIKDPYPGDFGVTPMKTLQVTQLGIVEIYAGTTFLTSFSARVTFDCQNLNGQLVFPNTHPDVWGTTASGTLTDVFSAVVSCAT